MVFPILSFRKISTGLKLFALEELLEQALTEFFREISQEKWPAKERELVSRFAFSVLVRKTGINPAFFDPGQLGIEVRVKQVPGENRKEHVCKDLLIWKRPNSSAWTEFNVPLVILEWKHNHKRPSLYDIKWLEDYSRINPECIGIALNIDTKSKFKLSASLIKKGEVIERNWLDLVEN